MIGPIVKTALYLMLPALALLASCEKYKDEPGPSDPRLSRKYCNDPEAVNYNLDFPGTADNSVCYYPTDAFKGSFSFVDSIYLGTNKLGRLDTVNLVFTPNTRTKMTVTGFCDGGNTLSFTVNRALRATGDTTVLEGQQMCRTKDTVSGYITRSLADSTRLKFNLTVVSDTGVTFHQGTAYRQ